MGRFLPFALFFVIATTFMGTAVVAVLTMKLFATSQPILMAAGLGLLLSLPVTYMVAKKLS